MDYHVFEYLRLNVAELQGRSAYALVVAGRSYVVRGRPMNAIKCYLTRAEVKRIVAEEVARRLKPEQMLGEVKREITMYDDGRIEVIFYVPDSGLGPDEDWNTRDVTEKTLKEQNKPTFPRLVTGKPSRGAS